MLIRFVYKTYKGEVHFLKKKNIKRGFFEGFF